MRRGPRAAGRSWPALHIRALTLQSCWRLDEALELLRQLTIAAAGIRKSTLELPVSSGLTLGGLTSDAGGASELGQIHALPLERNLGPLENDRNGEKRLRVGYVSGDFCDHAASHFVLAILEQHDPSGFEVFCYSSTEKLDETTARLRRHTHQWRDIRWMRDGDAAAAIRADAIDILVDLSGHTRANRLKVFAQRAAPVQVTYLGYPRQRELSTMDYRITDALTDPPGKSERGYCETLLRMPHSMWCFQRPWACQSRADCPP